MRNKNICDLVLTQVMTITDKELADFSVAKLANSLEINRFKLTRLFKQQKGMTLEQVLLNKKMDRAAFLLRTNTVKEVAERIGYLTSDYFIRSFKRYFGVPPDRYKELILDDEQTQKLVERKIEKSKDYSEVTPITPKNFMKRLISKGIERTKENNESTEHYAHKILIKPVEKLKSPREKKTEIWENITLMYSQILDINEENQMVCLRCKYERDSDNIFEKIFPLKHFKNKDKLVVDQAILIKILEKPGEVRFLFEEVEESYFDEDLDKISINDLKNSPIFNPL